MTKNLVKEKYSFIHTIEYQDEHETIPVQLAAIAKNEEELCKELVLKSIKQIHGEFFIK